MQQNVDILNAVKNSNLVVITGLTKSGKTTKALEIFTDLCNEQQNCVFLYHDSETKYILSKVLDVAQSKNIDLQKTSGDLVSVYAMSLDQLLEMIENYEKPDYASDKQTFFFIEDFLGFKNTENRYDRMDSIKKIAEKKNVTVIVEMPYVELSDMNYLAKLKYEADCLIKTDKANCEIWSKNS